MKTVINVTCPFCRKVTAIEVEDTDLIRYEHGAYACDVFPYLSEEEYETVVSGLCSDCQQELYDSGDAEDYDPDCDLECGFDPYMGGYSFDC